MPRRAAAARTAGRPVPSCRHPVDPAGGLLGQRGERRAGRSPQPGQQGGHRVQRLVGGKVVQRSAGLAAFHQQGAPAADRGRAAGSPRRRPTGPGRRPRAGCPRPGTGASAPPPCRRAGRRGAPARRTRTGRAGRAAATTARRTPPATSGASPARPGRPVTYVPSRVPRGDPSGHPGPSTARGSAGVPMPGPQWLAWTGANRRERAEFRPGTDPGVLRGWAQTVEGLGFDLLMVSDHIAITPDVAEQYPAPFYEPFTTLSWLAGVTRRVRLGTTVLIVPYRHPLLMARMAANLDRLSGGRLVLGVGVGWARQEFEALGVPFERRGRLTDEYLQTMRDGLGGRRDYGRAIPIWVGGNSDAGLRRAVRARRRVASAAGHAAWLREARGTAAGHRGRAGPPVPALAPRIALRLTGEPVTEPGRLAGEGTIDQVAGDLEQLRLARRRDRRARPVQRGPRQRPDSPRRAWRALAAVAARHTRHGATDERRRRTPPPGHRARRRRRVRAATRRSDRCWSAPTAPCSSRSTTRASPTATSPRTRS